MSDNAVHTVPGEGMWLNEVAARQIGERYRTRDEAVAAGRSEATSRRVEHHIHDEHGLLERTDDYSERSRGAAPVARGTHHQR